MGGAGTGGDTSLAHVAVPWFGRAERNRGANLSCLCLSSSPADLPPNMPAQPCNTAKHILSTHDRSGTVPAYGV